MIPGLSLIGAGMDSCIVDTRELTLTSSFYTIEVFDTCNLSGFGTYTYDNLNGTGILITGGKTSVVSYCKPQKANEGITINGPIQNKPLVYKNIILDVENGISNFFSQAIIEDNIVYSAWVSHGLVSGLNSRATFINNTVICSSCGEGYGGSFSYSSKVKNNLFYGSGNTGGGIVTYSSGDSIENNIIYNKNSYWGLGITGASANIRNNHIEKTLVGLDYDIGAGGPPPVFKYNNLWDNQSDYQNFIGDSTNIYSDPMFDNPDSMDFHLQKYSPLIDAGDPDIPDIDGSRSDIGLFGGPYGERYAYQDLPPRAPVNLSAALDTDYIVLSWNRNTEADFSHYNLYRDTTENFTADSTTFAASTPDTFYLNIIPQGIDNLYFKLTAEDNQGNASEPSEELHIVLTGITDNEQFTINDYRLFQNYPNPFNPSTRIGYRLKERGYVKLYVYDIKGELLKALVNQFQEGGYYEVEFNTSENQGFSSGIYIYQILMRNENNIPVFTDIKKMVYIK